MALPLQPGLTPMEVAFLCEMEMVTVIPRQRLESLNLLGGLTPALRPPHRAPLPLWLALLLKRQRRANILPPPWLLPSSLDAIKKYETDTSPQTFSPPPPHPYQITSRPSPSDHMSPPFLPSSTADSPPDYLPYHWLELGEILLEACPDDIPEPDRVRTLLRDLREVRMAKMRASVRELEGGGVSSLKGVGAMEVSEGRAFIVGVMDGLRKLGASREVARREREEDEGGGADGLNDEDEDMGFE
ncbi:GINS complex, PSF2 component [Acephala macrosclerotiorum]|nr:GINS complex, PSF2 component [Acephala macrosclerotiorum]